MPLEIDSDLTRLRPHPQNPRFISEDDIAALRASVTDLGIVKPIIARGDLTVAGHQRTKALLAEGVTRAPVYQLDRDITDYDVVRFVQLHNGTDLDLGDERARVPARPGARGFATIPPEGIKGNLRAKGAIARSHIADLIVRYGAWGACVATESGEVIHCAQYALACAMTGSPLLTYYVADEDRERYVGRLSRQYGVYSYERIERKTFLQSFAQMFRLREGAGQAQRSALYDRHVIPWLERNPGARVLDFGAGQGDYAKLCRKQGHNVLELEFYRRAKGKDALNVSAVNRMIDRALGSVREHGRFDAVVCDCVLNSVDSPAAERAVLTMLNLFTKRGGTVFFSGRFPPNLHNTTKQAGSLASNPLYFLDDSGFTAAFRRGGWFFQKFHTEEQARALAADPGCMVLANYDKHPKLWMIEARKEVDPPAEQCREAIRFEFDLPVSPTRRLGRHGDALEVFSEWC